MGTYRSQVLLRDRSWIHRVVDRVPEAPFGVEWCSGRGALTGPLRNRWDRLLALEIEQRFCRELRRTLPREVMVVCADVLEFPLPRTESTYPLVGNLPYHLTGPLLMRLLNHHSRLSGFYGLVQKEVGERLNAEPSSSEYGGLSLLVSVYASVRSPFTIPAEAFEPEPEVDSSWVEFSFREPAVEEPFERVRKLVRHCFRHPRKTLLNNLAGSRDEKNWWRDRFQAWGWSDTRRPATLEAKEVGRLMEAWNQAGSSSPRTSSREA